MNGFQTKQDETEVARVAVAWELLRASYRLPKPGGDLSVILDLGTDLFAASALVMWFGILLRLTF